MVKRFLHILLLFLIVHPAKSQDLAFSQFYETPLLRNPALAGVFDGDIRIAGAFRSQWQSITIPYQTSAFSTEIKFPIGKYDDWITAGVQITQDVAGDIKLKRTQFLPVVNFHKSLSGNNNNYLSLAFMGGPVNSQFDPTQLKLDDQYQNGVFNPNSPTGAVFSKTGLNYWDIGTGISYTSTFGENNTTYYIGAALFHANKPKVGFYTTDGETTMQRKITFNAGLNLPVSDMHKFLIYGDYIKQGGNEQFLGGVMFGADLLQNSGYNYSDYESITLYGGAFYRWNDALIPVIKLDMYQFSLGLSYDANISQLKTASQSYGGFELTATYKAKFASRSANANKVKCISF
jgi:type IX secretion system PorP/SprF family membrane protein